MGVTVVDRGYEIWTSEPLFRGRTIFLLAGGPSLRDFDIERLHGHAVMAINSSHALCPWADVLYFQDHSWFLAHREAVERWPGLVVTAARHTKAALPDRVRRIAMIQRSDFTRDEPDLKFGRSSGHTAISLAIAMHASRVILLGYDMRIVDGRSHHHDEYQAESLKLYRDDFLVYFEDWNQAAVAMGVEVVNCTPGSALTEFPTGDVADFL